MNLIWHLHGVLTRGRTNRTVSAGGYTGKGLPREGGLCERLEESLGGRLAKVGQGH